MIYGGHFDFDQKESEIKDLEEELHNPTIWDNPSKATELTKKLSDKKKEVDRLKNLLKTVETNAELLEIADDEMMEQLTNELPTLDSGIEEVRLGLLLSGPYDSHHCLLEVHSGAGGTEACDWALMLYRMYTRWCEQKGYTYEILEYQVGEEAGLKSATLLIKGENAFGYLKSEKGVHRLVRLSPFDSNNRRHTSFASIDITPEFDQTVEIDIKDSDLKIDVYHSSGAGGQSVNTTDSAVRITHLPTKIVVTCQNERSQLQNKEKAMQILKSKLYNLELEKKERELKNIKGESSDINFGSQIRSYVMHPYSMVKDHRTKEETSNVDKVLDGDLDSFMISYLKDVN